jgi:rhomboid protease GluP
VTTSSSAILAEQQPRIPVTLSLIVLNSLVFLAMLTQGAGWLHASTGLPLAWGANFGPATKDGEWWRLGSAMFLHFGVFHLGMNMFSLWDGGRLVERMYGPARFILIYVIAGLTGNLLSLFAQGDQAVSAGASGAIFGVYGALISYLWLARHRQNAGEYKRLFWGALLFAMLAIGLGFLIKGIDNYAHLGGLAGGLFIGLMLAPANVYTPRFSQATTRGLAGVSLVLAVALMIAHMPDPPYRWSEEQRAQTEINAFKHTEIRLHAEWQHIVDRAQQGELTFDQLAGEIETQITTPYENSFEQLSRLHLDPDAPSAPALQALRLYTENRAETSRALAKALREKELAHMRQSVDETDKH